MNQITSDPTQSISSDTSDPPSRSITPGSNLSSRSYKLAAKGHRNLFIRGTTTLMNAIVTSIFISSEIDISHQPFLVVCQLVASASLYIQWRTGRPSMFVVRGCASFAQAIIISHTIMCGRRWYFWDECVEEAWADFRLPLRILTSLAFIRLICNGISLCCQFRYPHRMFRGRGNEQLFYRGCIQATGVPINLAKSILELTVLYGTKYERLPAEVIGNFIRAFVIIPIASASLINQWWLTKKGATGHATSDAYERLMDPSIDCPLQRVKVTIVSASGLRNADFCGMSDPFCICEVLGRPESTWETKVIDNTREPVWNEGCELKVYRLHDALKFSIRDFDKQYIKCWTQAHDPLGDVTLKSYQFHPHGFDGDLMLQGAGKGKHTPTIKVKIELLDTEYKSLILDGEEEYVEKSLLATAEDTDIRSGSPAAPTAPTALTAPSPISPVTPAGMDTVKSVLCPLDNGAARCDVLLGAEQKSNTQAVVEKTPAENSRESTADTRIPADDWSELTEKNETISSCKVQVESFNQSLGYDDRETLKNAFNELEPVQAQFVERAESVDCGWQDQTSCGLVAWCGPPRPSPSTAAQCPPCCKSTPVLPPQQTSNFRRV